jgi:hypothetical protein
VRDRRRVFGTVRRYRGLDRSLVDAVAAQAAAIQSALIASPGCRGCEVIGTREGLIVVALGDDEAAVVEAGRRFVAWVDRHIPDLRVANPEVWAGEVLVHGASRPSGEPQLAEQPIR